MAIKRKSERGTKLIEYIDESIKKSGKLQIDIAKELGFESPNFISILKRGESPLPDNQILPLSKAIGADPEEMLRRYVQDYSPGWWPLVKHVFVARFNQQIKDIEGFNM